MAALTSRMKKFWSNLTRLVFSLMWFQLEQIVFFCLEFIGFFFFLATGEELCRSRVQIKSGKTTDGNATSVKISTQLCAVSKFKKRCCCYYLRPIGELFWRHCLQSTSLACNFRLRMNKDKYGLSLKLEKTCRANKEIEF